MLAITLAVAIIACGGNEAAPQDAVRPAPKALSAQPAATVQAEEPADGRPVIAAFGDSITAGYGLDSSKSFPSDLQRTLDAEGYTYHVVNLGVSGDTTTDGLERISSVTAIKPAIVLLEFGANDGLRGQPVAGAKKNLAAIIELLQRGGSTVVLAGMTLPRNYGSEYIAAFDQMYVELAQEYKLTRIPFLLDKVGGVPQLTQPDGLHPTAAGAEIVAQNALQYLRPLLKKRLPTR